MTCARGGGVLLGYAFFAELSMLGLFAPPVGGWQFHRDVRAHIGQARDNVGGDILTSLAMTQSQV
jgi:hypothetical protein